MPKGTNPNARVTIVVTMVSGNTLTVFGKRTTKVEEVKKMIAEKLRGCWLSYGLVYGTQELENAKTLAESSIRGKVTLSLLVNHVELESEASGPPSLVSSDLDVNDDESESESSGSDDDVDPWRTVVFDRWKRRCHNCGRVFDWQQFEDYYICSREKGQHFQKGYIRARVEKKKRGRKRR